MTPQPAVPGHLPFAEAHIGHNDSSSSIGRFVRTGVGKVRHCRRRRTRAEVECSRIPSSVETLISTRVESKHHQLYSESKLLATGNPDRKRDVYHQSWIVLLGGPAFLRNSLGGILDCMTAALRSETTAVCSFTTYDTDGVSR